MDCVASLNSLNKAARQEFTKNDAADMQKILSTSYNDLIQMIKKSGTDVEANSRDPFGDGDQSPVHGKKAQILREVWFAGGDFFNVLESGGLSDFSTACFTGCLSVVRKHLSKVSGDAKRQLLERRECIPRQTPLITCIVGMKCMVKESVGESGGKWKEVVQLLLEEGAAVNARDIAGHTACFHASGCSSNAETLNVLQILMAARGDVNLPNRFGNISLHEAVMGDNMLALQTLLACGADLNHADLDGCTPLELAKTYPAALAIVSAHSKSPNAKAAWRAVHRVCAQCSISKEAGMLLCSRCKATHYCSKACQLAHWPAHKPACAAADEDAVAISPDPTAELALFSGRAVRRSGPVVAPPGAGRTFVVKVQLPFTGPTRPYIYDETRTVELMMPSDHPRAGDVARAVTRAGAGVPKAYFRARAADGQLHLLLGRPVTLRDW